MLKDQVDIRQFMQLALQPLPSQPSISDGKTRILRIKLILEELVELTEASGFKLIVNNEEIMKNLSNVSIVNTGLEPNLKEMIDAITDINYVNVGAANAFGFDLEKSHDIVHGSNMTKLWTYYEVYNYIGEETLGVNNHDEKPNLVGVWFSPGKDKFEVAKVLQDVEKCYALYNHTGKLIKSPSYIPADLSVLIPNGSI